MVNLKSFSDQTEILYLNPVLAHLELEILTSADLCYVTF